MLATGRVGPTMRICHATFELSGFLLGGDQLFSHDLDLVGRGNALKVQIKSYFLRVLILNLKSLLLISSAHLGATHVTPCLCLYQFEKGLKPKKIKYPSPTPLLRVC